MANYRAQNFLTGALEGAGAGAGIGAYWPGDPATKIAALGIGAIGGAIVGGITGLLSSTEQQELAARYARGEIDEATENQIAKQIAGRYARIHRNVGADIARRGLMNSTIGGRLMADSYNAEGQALTDAIARTAFERQRMGLAMQGDEAARRSAALGQATSAALMGLESITEEKRYQAAKTRQEEMDDAIKAWLAAQTAQKDATPPSAPAAQRPLDTSGWDEYAGAGWRFNGNMVLPPAVSFLTTPPAAQPPPPPAVQVPSYPKVVDTLPVPPPQRRYTPRQRGQSGQRRAMPNMYNPSANNIYTGRGGVRGQGGSMGTPRIPKTPSRRSIGL